MNAELRVRWADVFEESDDKDCRRPAGARRAICGPAQGAISGRNEVRRTCGPVWRAFQGLGWLLLALVSPGAMAQTSGGTPRTIRGRMGNNYAPYSVRSNDGRLQGMLGDPLRGVE